AEPLNSVLSLKLVSGNSLKLCGKWATLFSFIKCNRKRFMFTQCVKIHFFLSKYMSIPKNDMKNEYIKHNFFGKIQWHI
ncbi:hypothetical protein C0J52_25342, partial [Blattella germanica]